MKKFLAILLCALLALGAFTAFAEEGTAYSFDIIEQNLFGAAAGLSYCRLVCIITPVGADVKGGEAVHLALDVRSQRCYPGMRPAK